MFRTMTKSIYSLLVAMAFTLLPGAPAYAVNNAMLDLLKVLRDKGTLSAAEYEMLINAARADGEQVEGKVNEMQASLDKKTKSLPTINTRGKLEIKQGDNKFRIGGRIMYDYAFVNEDAGRDGEKTELLTGHEFRRARIFFSGTLWKLWDFKFQTDFAGNEVDNKEWTLAYKGFKDTKIVIGSDKEPFSLEEMNSSKYITFMERALPNDLAPGRNTGIQITHHRNNFTIAGGLFGDGFDTQDSEPAWSLTGRATYAPVAEEDKVLHLGLAGSYRKLDSDNEVRFRARPEIHTSAQRLVNTGNQDANSYSLLGLEAAGVYGPFSLQGEWIRASLSGGGGSEPTYNGYYVYGSYYLTGESRRYSTKSGTFKQTRVRQPLGKGGFGAWELGLRFSGLDLTDKDVLGGEEKNLTVGLNWYPNNNVRFMANYVQVLDLDNGSENDGAEPSAFMLRSQLYF